MKRIAVLINASASRMFLDGLASFGVQFGSLLEARVHYVHDIEEEQVAPDQVRESLAAADLVLLDVRGSGRATALAGAALQGSANTVVLLVGGAPEVLSLVRMGPFSMKEMLARKKNENGKGPDIQRMQNLMRWAERLGDVLPVGTLRHARNWAKAMRYWTSGGAENVSNMLAFLGREYLGCRINKPDGPKEFPAHGIFDPVTGALCRNLAHYQSTYPFDSHLPVLGLLVYGGMHFEQSLAGAKALAERMRGKCNLVPVFASADSSLEALRCHFLSESGQRPDAVANFRWFQLATFASASSAEAEALLKEMDVPMFCPAPMYGREEAVWRGCTQGLSPVEVMTAVIMPELDGQIEPLPSIALREMTHDCTGLMLKGAHCLPAEMDILAKRIERRIELRYKDNSRKRVAFIIYDTPPGEDNIGNASYLDVFASIKMVVQNMVGRGYDFLEIPDNSELLRLFVQAGAVNNGRWVNLKKSVLHTRSMDGARFVDMLGYMHDSQSVIGSWGEAPGAIMVTDGKLIIPALEFGNCLIALQPSRGAHSDPDTITHDKTLPPHHQYIAFYKWLEEEYGADAVIHVGTHGTLEFLKGKEAGLSAECWPVQLIGALPHFYIYHCVNASEAMIAKRRGLATIVNYNSPPFTASGLYETYVDLEGLIAEYHEALLSDPGRAARVRVRVLEEAAKLELRKDTVEDVQDELALMKRSLIPKGLHVFGGIWSEPELTETVSSWLRVDRGEIPSLHRVLAEEKGLSYEILLSETSQVHDGKAGSVWLEELDAQAVTLVARAFAENAAPDGPWRAALQWALMIRDRLKSGLEMHSLLHALEGGFTPPGIGGEPGRDPEVLPTGRNSYQFDPRLVPSEAAYERGRSIAENTLEHFRSTHGRWPESTAVVLWAFETAKTRGETVGQIFGYIGVRPVRKNPWRTDLEVIPLEVLGRPRVDVTVQICGFFRDMFANVGSLINRAFALVADLDEVPADNPVRSHTLAARSALEARLGGEMAVKVASARVFGPRPGEYGTRVTSLIETAAWQTEDDIVRTFTDSMNHLYADNVHGERFEDLYRERLSSVELISQIRDTTDYEIADLDHYYEYFGGLARTVESVRGQAPVMLITDTTRELVRTESVGDALERGIRTRLLNPKWIDGMLAHDVHGAQKISERVQYLLGFAATTHAVRDWVFSAVASRFMFDEEMRNRLKDNNPFAAEEIARRLQEACKRGYWNASDQEIASLRDAFLELEGDIEEQTENRE